MSPRRFRCDPSREWPRILKCPECRNLRVRHWYTQASAVETDNSLHFLTAVLENFKENTTQMITEMSWQNSWSPEIDSPMNSTVSGITVNGFLWNDILAFWGSNASLSTPKTLWTRIRRNLSQPHSNSARKLHFGQKRAHIAQLPKHPVCLLSRCKRTRPSLLCYRCGDIYKKAIRWYLQEGHWHIYLLRSGTMNIVPFKIAMFLVFYHRSLRASRLLHRCVPRERPLSSREVWYTTLAENTER